MYVNIHDHTDFVYLIVEVLKGRESKFDNTNVKTRTTGCDHGITCTPCIIVMNIINDIVIIISPYNIFQMVTLRHNQ